MSKKAGKDRRAEQQFTAADRAMMVWLIDHDYGVEAVMERYGLSETAALEYIASDRATRRAKRRAATDWAAKFAEFRSAG